MGLRDLSNNSICLKPKQPQQPIPWLFLAVTRLFSGISFDERLNLENTLVTRAWCFVMIQESGLLSLVIFTARFSLKVKLSLKLSNFCWIELLLAVKAFDSLWDLAWKRGERVDKEVNHVQRSWNASELLFLSFSPPLSGFFYQAIVHETLSFHIKCGRGTFSSILCFAKLCLLRILRSNDSISIFIIFLIKSLRQAGQS